VDTVRSPRLLRATFTSPESQLAQAVAPGAPKRRGIGRLALHAEGEPIPTVPEGGCPLAADQHSVLMKFRFYVLLPVMRCGGR
jgi:hypothetical protein